MPPLPPMTPLTRGDNRNPPEPMDRNERNRYRLASTRVHRICPPPIAVIVARELMAWELFGWRLAHDAPMSKLVDYILEQTETAA